MKILWLAASFALMVSCGKPASKGRDFSGQAAKAAGAGDDAGAASVPMAISLASFTEHVYKPVLSSDCSSCHATTWAPVPKSIKQTGEGAEAVTEIEVPESIESAHKSFLEIVNFSSYSGVELTRPVTKLAGGHNCSRASDTECAKVMTTAIKAWLDDLEKAGFKPTPAFHENSTALVPMSGATAGKGEVDTAFDVGAGVDTATIAAPWKMATDDPDGPLESYATTDDTQARNAGNAVAAQIVTFNLDAKTAGEYDMWVRVKSKSTNNVRVSVGVNNAGFTALTLPVTGTEWKWIPVTVTQNNVTRPVKATVAVGRVTFRVGFQDPGIRVSYVALTKRVADFDGEVFSRKYYEITVPLKVADVANASIVALVWDVTIADGSKSLGVKKLMIRSDVPLAIKGVKPLINGIHLINTGAYEIVDTVAGGPDPLKQTIQTGGSTATTWVADRTTDTLGFAFDAISKAP